MGRPTGFLEYPRATPLTRPARERLGDWREFHGHLPEATMREQDARCMDCGVPFCHTGTLVDGLIGCPLHNPSGALSKLPLFKLLRTPPFDGRPPARGQLGGT